MAINVFPVFPKPVKYAVLEWIILFVVGAHFSDTVSDVRVDGIRIHQLRPLKHEINDLEPLPCHQVHEAATTIDRSNEIFVHHVDHLSGITVP